MSTTVTRKKITWEKAGTLATGEPVFWGINYHDENDWNVLSFWVSLTKSFDGEYARLSALGIDEEMLFDTRYEEHPDDPRAARAACRARWFAYVENHLATLSQAQYAAAIA